ncbi:hypothetical protein ACMX25_12370 [Caballeronia sp. 15715]|uniref:hypothetical protein n=1 Tax=Caballeronia sp. 15715 TaxID=3391030 RepID=UPI0039E5B504
MANSSKLADATTQTQRAGAFAKATGLWTFVLIMSIPILDILAGLFMVLWFSVNIINRSAQRGRDFFWLFAGTVICLLGFAIPAATDSIRGVGFGGGWFLDVIVNVLVGWLIVGRKLGHLFGADPKAPEPAA